MTNRGIALISVLITLLVITPIVYKVAGQQQIDLVKAQANKGSLATISDALAVEMWARKVLLDDLNQNQHDSNEETWTLPLPATISDASVVSGSLHELNSRLNLNNYFYNPDPDFVKILHNLLTGLDVSSSTATNILNALKDWMDVDLNPRPQGGGEDDYYMLLENPYRAANNMLTDISELKLLRGMTLEIYEKIKPFVTALPRKTKVNINTASNEVLKAIFPPNSHSFISGATLMNGGVEYTDMAQFWQDYQSNVGAKPPDIQDKVGVRSNYFIADIKSALDGNEVKLNSLLYRDTSVQVLNRYFKD